MEFTEAEELVQRLTKESVFEDAEDVPVKIETRRPSGKAYFPDGNAIYPERARGAVFLCRVSHRDAVLFGLDRPQDPPLPG